MGKNTDKPYITQSEWAQGDHSVGGGKKATSQAPGGGSQKNPFWYCTIGQQAVDPKNIMCDKLGFVYDIRNVVPYLVKRGKVGKKGKGVPHPVVEGATLARTDLMRLVVTTNSDGQLIDPVSFREMSRYNTAVVIRSSKRVYLEDTVAELGKAGRDPVSNEPFTSADVVKLRSCLDHSEASESVAAASGAVFGTASSATPSDTPLSRKGTTTHHVAASLTSTAFTPTTTATMVEEDVVDSLKPKMPQLKDPVYALMSIDCQGAKGQLRLELYPYNAPLTVYNFIKLAQDGYYDGTVFHRNIIRFMIQGGDPTGTGSGGESIFGKTFRDECGTFNPHTHDGRGVLSMANKGKGTNSSQFFITYTRAPHLDGKHTVFGRVVDEKSEFLTTLEMAETKDSTPTKPIILESIRVSSDPFEFLTKQVNPGDEEGGESSTKDDTPFLKKQVGESGKIGRYLKISADVNDGEDGEDDLSSSFVQKRKRVTSLGKSDFSGW